MFDRDKSYVSIDIETTGLDPNNDQVLEIAAVIDDNQGDIYMKPLFHCVVKHQRLHGSVAGIAFNSKLIAKINSLELTPYHEFLDWVEGERDWTDWKTLVLTPSQAAIALAAFLSVHFDGKATVAGKNFGSFDRCFLEALPGFPKDKFRHRYIDTGNLWWDPERDGFVLPDSDTVVERAGKTGKTAHLALEDALDTCQAVRRYLKL